MTKRVYALLLTALFLFIGAQLKTEIFPLRTQDTPKQKISCYWDSPHQSKTTTTQVEKQETAQRVKLNEVKRKQVAASFVSETTGTGTNVTAQMTSAEQLPEMAETAEVNCPETVFHGETDYMRVTVRAAEGVFPYGTEMRVEPVDSEIALQAVNNSGHEASDAMAVDITFWYEDEEVQPEGNVSVFLHAKSQIAGNMHQAMTINDEGVATLLGSAGETASLFNTNHFTVYGIVGTTYQDEDIEQKSRIVYWYHAGNPEDSPADWPAVRKEIYAEGDMIENPADPAGNATHVFAGYWYVGDATGTPISPEQQINNGDVIVIPDSSKNKGPAESDLDVVHVYPKFNTLYKVTFYANEEKTGVLKTVIGVDGLSVSLINEMGAKTNGLKIMEGKSLVAWKDADGNEIRIEDDGVVGMVTVNGEDIDLVPVYADAHRVSFDLVLEEVFTETIPEQVVENGGKIENTSGYQLDAVYKFYKFGGWYMDDNFHPDASTLDEKYTGEPVDLDNWILNDSDDNNIVLHAKWIPDKVMFPVTPFRESQNAPNTYEKIAGDTEVFEWEPGTDFPISNVLSYFNNTHYVSTESSIGKCHLSGNGILDDDATNGILVDGVVLPAFQVLGKDG